MSYQYNELVCVAGMMQSLDMSHITFTTLFPCVNSASGCNALLPVSQMKDHVENCDYRVISCPYPDGSCAWKGPIDHMFKHLFTYHPKIATCHGADQWIKATGINHAGPLNWFIIQSCFGQNFAIVLGRQYRGDAEQYYSLVQLIGSSTRCQNFTYRMELSGYGRILAWEGTTRSIFDGMRAVIESCDCFMFDTHTTKFFADNETLQIHVRISTTNQDRYQSSCNEFALPQPQPQPTQPFPKSRNGYSNYEIPVIQID